MSLLALMADKFELEPAPPDDDNDVDNINNVTTATSRSVDEQDDVAAIANFSLLHTDVAQSYEKQQKVHKAVVDKSAMLITSHDDNQPITDNSPGGDSNDNDNNIGGGATESNNSNSGSSNMSNQQETKLLITFLLMVIVGTANKVFQKLQAIPMYNYPNSLNLLQNFVYVPLCFAYILPVSRFGLLNNAIPHEVTTLPKTPFAIMGLLDCITCMLLTFAAVYLPGSLLILLPQAAIPISMVLSKKIKGETYARYQYLGAVVVVLGILVVLEPLVTQRHTAGEFVCEAYDREEFCALCEEEVGEEGCLSHRTKGSATVSVSSLSRVVSSSLSDSLYHHHGLDEVGGVVGSVGIAFLPSWDEGSSSEFANHVMLRSLAQTNSSAASSTTYDGELCRWIPSDSAQPSSSNGSSATATTLLWSILTILACVPMTLSSIYKEQALTGAQSNIDPIFLNGWVALFQLLFSFPLSVPAGMTSDPPVTPGELPGNIWDGIKCYLGMGTITSGCHPDDLCYESPLYVNVFLVFNVCFNILIVYILKFGSANVLFMASTVMVPVGNLAFALPFVPGSTPLKDSDIAGLMVILLGLVTYRFGQSFKLCAWLRKRLRTIPPLPWRRGKTRYRRVPGILNDFEWDAPIFDDENESDLGVVRSSPPSSLLEEPLLPPIQ